MLSGSIRGGRWGPVTQNKINLDGIDSAPGRGGEVLELIGRFDAKTATQEMLLDDFMEVYVCLAPHVGRPRLLLFFA